MEGGKLPLTAIPSPFHKGLPGYPGLKGEMGEMGPQVRLVGVGTGMHEKGLPSEPQDKGLIGENDKGTGDTLAVIGFPREWFKITSSSLFPLSFLLFCLFQGPRGLQGPLGPPGREGKMVSDS